MSSWAPGAWSMLSRPARETRRSRPTIWAMSRSCNFNGRGQYQAGARTPKSRTTPRCAVGRLGAEVLVGRTELSYTYTQTPKEGTPYNLYHGTLEARPVTPTTSKIVYTLFFDNSMLPDDAAWAADKERRRARFMQALQNMKTLAEGDKLN
jgi:hypothetical protein